MNKVGKYIVALFLLWALAFWAATLCQSSYDLGIYTGEVRMLEKFIDEGVVKKENIPKEYFGVNGRFKDKFVTHSICAKGSEIAVIIFSIFIVSMAVKTYRKTTSNHKTKTDEK